MRILAVLGGGGHTTETLMLLNNLGKENEYCYVTNEGDNLSPHAILFRGPIYSISTPGGWGDGIFQFVVKSVRSIIESLIIVHRSNSDMIVSVGKDITVPVTLAGKLLGKKIVSIESMQKVYTKSLCGRIVYPYADMFFVQWPELRKQYKKAIFAGRLA